MTEYQPGGRRRIDRVLAPEFPDDVASLTDDELRRRHDDAHQEETDLSYVRRLLQGRLDLLRSEKGLRASGAPPATFRTDDELVEQLKRVLADDSERGAIDPHYLDVEPSRVGEHRRAVEALVADVVISDVTHLDDPRLTHAIARLAAMEHQGFPDSTRRAARARPARVRADQPGGAGHAQPLTGPAALWHLSLPQGLE